MQPKPLPDYLITRNKTLITKQDKNINDYAPGIKVVPSDIKERILTLSDFARNAIDKSYAPITGRKVGAAILTNDGHVYTGSVVESNLTAATICAERAAIIKAITEGDISFDSLVIYGDSVENFPYPCGSCRQFMAEYGDFFIALMKSDGAIRIYKASSLLPNPSKPIKPTLYKSALDEIVEELSKDRGNRKDNAMLWTKTDVGDWLSRNDFSRYIELFERNNITGEKLLELTEDDLRIIGVDNAHFPRMNSIIRELREDTTREHYIENKQIKEYVDLLDRDRIRTIARLKRVFDIYDLDRDGFINRIEVQLVLEKLHNTSNENVRSWLKKHSSKNDLISFEDFVECYTNLASGKIPPEPSHKKINDIRLYDDDDDIEYIIRKYNRRSSSTIPLRIIRDIKDNFTRYDENKDNRINIDEVINILDKIGDPIDKEQLIIFFKGRGLISMEYISFVDILEAYIALVINKTLREPTTFKRVPVDNELHYTFYKAPLSSKLPDKNNTNTFQESKIDKDIKRVEDKNKRNIEEAESKREDYFGDKSKKDDLSDNEFDDFDKPKDKFEENERVDYKGDEVQILKKMGPNQYKIELNNGDKKIVSSDTLSKLKTRFK